MDAMWLENSDGSAFTIGFFDFSKAAEYTYDGAFLYISTLICRGSSIDPQ